MLDAKLQLSSAYQPQIDGQAECVNQCLEMFLRCAVHDTPTKWFNWLALAEFWYNTSPHSVLGCSPFKALYGVEPVLANSVHTEVADLLKELV